jgi:ornithine cyclodeaminase
MVVLEDSVIYERASPLEMVAAMRHAFSADIWTPRRTVHSLPGEDSTLFLMPAQGAHTIGVKVATAIPANAALGEPTVNGLYLLLERTTGRPLAILSARALTQVRTAAVSAMASALLSRAESSCLLMVGTGALAPHLVRAHAAVRPIRHILLWGRSQDKAGHLMASLTDLDCSMEVVADLEQAAGKADIISCATLSPLPLVLGSWLRPGTHVDLVGSFSPSQREADDALIGRATVYVDTLDAFAESGDLIGPCQAGILDPCEVADLTVLAASGPVRAKPGKDITVFKSVGSARADLAAAERLVNCEPENQPED